MSNREMTSAVPALEVMRSDALRCAAEEHEGSLGPLQLLTDRAMADGGTRGGLPLALAGGGKRSDRVVVRNARRHGRRYARGSVVTTPFTTSRGDGFRAPALRPVRWPILRTAAV